MRQADHLLHLRHDQAVAAGPVREGTDGADRRHTDPPPRSPLPSRQIAELPLHILAKVEGIAANVDEVIMLDAAGYVAEASGMNLFAVSNSTLRTPPPYTGILRGVTRDTVIELGREAGYGVEELPMNRYDLYTADEVFLTGTAAEVIGISKLDGRAIGKGVAGPVTRDLATRFRAYVSRDD